MNIKIKYIILFFVVLTLVGTIALMVNYFEKESHYDTLTNAIENKSISVSRKALGYFQANNLMDYKDVQHYSKKIDELILLDRIKHTNDNDNIKISQIYSDLLNLFPNNSFYIIQHEIYKNKAIKEKEAVINKQTEIITRKREQIGWYITKGSSVAAISESLLLRAIEIGNQGDFGAFRKYITENNPYVFLTKDGVKVYLEEYKLWKGIVKVRPQGQTISIWMKSTAIEELK